MPKPFYWLNSEKPDYLASKELKEIEEKEKQVDQENELEHVEAGLPFYKLSQ